MVVCYPVQVIPRDYKRAIQQLKEEEEAEVTFCLFVLI